MSWFAIGGAVATGLGASATTAGVVGAAAAVGGAAYGARQKEKVQDRAIEAQRGIAENLKYEPIDINKLKLEATQNAIANATASLAIERSLQPDVSATREELARQIRADLERGGELPTDVANTVTTAGRVIGGRSGVGPGGTTPLTAALLGLKSTDLIDDRRRAAERLLSTQDLPVAGLDPGQLASLEVANNAAMNEFNLMKAGVDSNLASSEAAAKASQLGAQGGVLGTLRPLAERVGNIFSTPEEGYFDKNIKKGTSGLGLLETYKPLGGAQPFAGPIR